MTAPKRQNVCMIAYTNYATDGRVRLEAETLAGWGYPVTVLTLAGDARLKSTTASPVRIQELRVRKYRGKSNLLYVFSYLHFLLAAFFGCTRLFFAGRADIVHVHNMPDFLVLAALVPRIFGRRLILDVHDSVPETYAAKFDTNSRLVFALLRWEEAICCWLADKVICVNHVQRETLIARGIPGEKIATVISVHLMAAPAEVRCVQPEKFRMVWHGTVSRRLGIDLIVRAAAQLATRIPGFELHVYGTGEDLGELKALANSLNANGHIQFRGQVPWDALPRELAAMDVGIVGNRRNIATDLMLPIKLIDFVALEIAAVVPRLRTIQYYFNDEMVTFFEPDNVESIVEATLALYHDPRRRNDQAKNARVFLENYRWDKQGGLRDVYGSTA